MKELNDDELQQWLEGRKNVPAGAPGDMRAYKTLFDLLQTEPEGELPYNFSAKVARAVEMQAKRKIELKYNVLAACVFVLVLFAGYLSIRIYNPTLSAELVPYKWLGLVAPFLFIAIQYLDQQLVKKKLFRGL